MKLSDYVFEFIKNKKIDTVFTVSGGGCMHLIDSLGKSGINYVCNHHEQACAMAAVGYSKVNNQIAVVMPTTGCGGTNTITGLLDAWQDSNKVVFISGNVNKKETTYCSDVPLRKFGVQEANIIKIVTPITKYAVMIENANDIAYELEKAYELATTGRPGPVWIDIPMDMQSAILNKEDLIKYEVPVNYTENYNLSNVVDLIKNSVRPIILAGHGVRLSKSQTELKQLIEKLKIPVVLSWSGIDNLPFNHDYNFGCPGLYGQRCANFVIQNCDLLIVLGSRLSLPQTGYNINNFAPEAKIVMVNNDEGELKKHSRYDITINCDCKDFINNEKFLVFLGDNIIQIDISDYVKKFQDSDDAASIFLCKVDNPSR